MKYLYRYVRDYWEDGCSLELAEFKVLSETSKGFWISVQNKRGKRFVLKNKPAGKRFAYETKEEAIENFIRRTLRCKAYGRAQIKTADLFLQMAEKIKLEQIQNA